MKVAIRELLGSEVADRIDDFWGVDEEGEIKGAFRPSGRKLVPLPLRTIIILTSSSDANLWMHGGTCIQARYMSRFIALQVRAALDGTPLETVR